MADVDRVWSGSMPKAYERGLVPAMFTPFARVFADEVARLEPGRLLELAAGTGALTRELVSRLGPEAVTATDLNPPMVDLGRSVLPDVAWEVADATKLGFADGSFDLVACQFGVMFFPDRPAAYREVGRVLAPGGRWVFLTWDSIEHHDFARVLVDVLEQELGGTAPPFVTDVPHGYYRRDQIEADLHAADMRVTRLEEITLTGSAAPDLLTDGFCDGTPLHQMLDAAGDLDRVRGALRSAYAARLGDPCAGSMTAFLVTAEPR